LKSRFFMRAEGETEQNAISGGAAAALPQVGNRRQKKSKKDE